MEFCCEVAAARTRRPEHFGAHKTGLAVAVREMLHLSLLRRREEERKKQGLPQRLGVLPHSTVAEEEKRWEAEQERRNERPKNQRK